MDKNLLKFRKAKASDAREWNLLVNKVWRDTYSNIFPEEVFVNREEKLEDKVKVFAENMKNDNETISYVAEYDGKVIGIMKGSIKSQYENFCDDYADLSILYIDPNFQRLGIGSTFRKTFEDWARENGATKYVIGVLKDNEKGRKAYESWGGKLSDYEGEFVRLGVGYPEVFYTYDL